MSQWVYFEKTDELREMTNYYASVRSSNSISLPFPYNEELTFLTLNLRHAAFPRGSIFFTVNQGQLAYDFLNRFLLFWDENDLRQGQVLRYKFDKELAEDMIIVVPDNCVDRTTMFMDSRFSLSRAEKKFIKKLKKHKKLIVELQFIDAGVQQFVFDVSGLEWNPNKKVESIWGKMIRYFIIFMVVCFLIKQCS